MTQHLVLPDHLLRHPTRSRQLESLQRPLDERHGLAVARRVLELAAVGHDRLVRLSPGLEKQGAIEVQIGDAIVEATRQVQVFLRQTRAAGGQVGAT